MIAVDCIILKKKNEQKIKIYLFVWFLTVLNLTKKLLSPITYKKNMRIVNLFQNDLKITYFFFLFSFTFSKFSLIFFTFCHNAEMTCFSFSMQHISSDNVENVSSQSFWGFPRVKKRSRRLF